MADDNINSNSDNTSRPTGILSTEQLRALAQSHLVKINEEITTEAQRQTAAQQEIQKYMKVRRKDRSKSPSTTASALIDPETVKGPRLRSAQDVLDRLRWDPSVQISEYIVGYLERFEGIREMPASNWVRESTDEEFLPQHRIKFIKRNRPNTDAEIVWHRESRTDKIFGTGVEFKSDDVAEEGGVAL